jgi:preprotein translocase subunit YajC
LTGLRAGRKISAPGGEATTIVSVEAEAITIAPPRAKGFVRIPKEDFEAVWRKWGDFKAGKVTRGELRQVTTKSSYIINIFEWFEG